jgi:capsular polysaccharide biosynthesis protein
LHNTRLNGNGYATPMYSGVDPNDVFRNGHEDEQLLVSPTDFIGVIWRRLWIIVLMSLVLMGLVLGFSVMQTPTYQASAKILLGRESANGAATDLNSELLGLQSLTPTVAAAVTTRPMVEDVSQKLDFSVSPQSLQQNLTAQPIEETQFMVISFEDPSPKRAQLVANTVGDVLSDRVAELGPEGSGSITATVWERAAVPQSPVSPDLIRNVFLALVMGLMLGVGLAFLLNYLDDSWSSADEVEQFSGVPTFGVVPKSKAFREATKRRPRREGPSESNTQG